MLFSAKENVFMCLVAFQKNFRKIFSDIWLYSWKYHRKHIFYLLLTFSQLPNKHIMSFIPKNSNKTQKRSYFLGEIAIAIGVISIGEIAIAISSISMIAIDADRCDRDRDRCRSAQFRWLARSRSWCVGVDRSVWLGVWVGAVKLWEKQCVCERGVRVREKRKRFEVKIRIGNDFSRFWLNFRSNWKYFQFDRIYHANQTPYFSENDFWISFSVKTNGAFIFKIFLIKKKNTKTVKSGALSVHAVLFGTCNF